MWSPALAALVTAIQSGDDDAAVQTALNGLTDVDEFGPDGRTALIHAAEWNRVAAVTWLLQHGADPTLPSRDYRTTPLLEALQERNVATTRLLLDAGRRVAEASPRTPLAEEDEGAVVSGDFPALMALLRQGVHPDSSLPSFPGFTLLSRSLVKGGERGASTLIQWGADTGKRVATSDGDWPPLHAAAQAGLEEIVWLLLLEGADPNRVERQWSALFLAAKLESPAIARMLLEAGAHVDLGLGQETPLMAAAEDGRLETVKLLLAHGADVNAASPSGWTPLHHAARAGHVEVARVLLDSGADPLRRDRDGYNAADHATHSFDPVYAQIYRDWGSPDVYSVEPVDDDWEPSGEFDYFISYRHGRFAKVAAALADHMRRAGLKTFIDRLELGLDSPRRTPRAVIKARLAKAVERSRTLLFFESYLDSERDPDDEDAFYSFKWQFFELLRARDALLLSTDGGWCARMVFGPGRRTDKLPLFEFSGLEDLVQKLRRYQEK